MIAWPNGGFFVVIDIKIWRIKRKAVFLHQESKLTVMDISEKFESSIKNNEFKILIVDDVPSNVLLLKLLLSKESFQVCTANNGDACIEQTMAEHPDLILLDVMMPGKDGFTTAGILKENPATADIPIIFLTALSSPDDLVKSFKVGGSDFLTKPFNKDELLVRVRHQIRLVAAKRLIVRQNAELRATISNRDKMYSVIAHDLRSPMASIRMVLNLVVSTLSADMVGPELFSLLDKVNRESEDVYDLLDNLLKWTKSQTGRLTVVEQDLDLNDIVPGVVEIFQSIALVKQIKLTYQGGSIMVRADNDMLKTIVRNFISNAIKFSPESSSVEVTATTEGGFAKVSVRDHGVGIDPDRLTTIFHKGETTYGTDGEEGSGLGLMLCEDFANKFGGDVSVESTLGEGSTFSVFIPLIQKV